MNTIWEYRGLFLSGAWTTLQLTIIASAMMMVIALIAGLARLSTITLLRWPAIVYIEFFRGTSLYVQVFWLYFALPLFGIILPAFAVAIGGLALCIGAYGAEVIRAAVVAIPRGQVEAAIALNYPRVDQLRHIIVPQALRAAIPPFNNLCIELLKGTALMALITVPDLTYQARLVTLRTYETMAAFGVILIVYFVISQLITIGFRRLEWNLAYGRAVVG